MTKQEYMEYINRFTQKEKLDILKALRYGNISNYCSGRPCTECICNKLLNKYQEIYRTCATVIAPGIDRCGSFRTHIPVVIESLKVIEV